MVFLTIPNNYKGITPDIFIFVIDNFVDEQNGGRYPDRRKGKCFSSTATTMRRIL